MRLRYDAEDSEYTNENVTTEWPRWVRPVLWIVLLATLVVAALPTLLYPFTRDQGIYAYIADLMMQGGAPFRDAWELKPPGVYFGYWLGFSLFGRSELAVRLLDVLYTLLSAASIYVLAQEVFRNRRVAACSAWIYAFCYYLLVHFHSAATPEAFMAPFLVASVYGMVRGVRSRSNLAWFLGGVASGFVFWFKPTAGLVILAVLIWACVEMWRERCSMRDVLCSLRSGGIAGPLAHWLVSLWAWSQRAAGNLARLRDWGLFECTRAGTWQWPVGNVGCDRALSARLAVALMVERGRCGWCPCRAQTQSPWRSSGRLSAVQCGGHPFTRQAL